MPTTGPAGCNAELPDRLNGATAARLSRAAYTWPGGRGVFKIDLHVRRGEVLALLGPNGAGKSTILKMLSGAIAPQHGGIQVFGASHGSGARRRIGLVLQESSSDDLMTVRETLYLHGLLFGLRGAVLKRRSAGLLDSLGIDTRADDRCETLSGGLRRRLDIARALLHDPDLLLLDEPTLSLDPDSSAAIWEALRARAASGIAIVICTNDTVEAEVNADRVAIVSNGRILADDTPRNLTAELKRDALELDWPDASDDELRQLTGWDGVGKIARTETALVLTVDRAAEIVPRLFQRYSPQIRGIRIRESSLRDAWFQMVGRPLSDRDDTR